MKFVSTTYEPRRVLLIYYLCDAMYNIVIIFHPYQKKKKFSMK